MTTQPSFESSAEPCLVVQMENSEEARSGEAICIMEGPRPEDSVGQVRESIGGNGYVEDDDDNMTIILVDNTSIDDDQGQRLAMDWISQTGPEMEERRRHVLIRELNRIQRASFLHFLLLCLIPTALLAVVAVTVFGTEEECASEATFCEREPRTFINAFTTRCVCEPIPVDRSIVRLP